MSTFPSPLPPTPAGRLELLKDLYRPPILDEEGNVIGYVPEGEGLISREELLRLLEMPTE